MRPSLLSLHQGIQRFCLVLVSAAMLICSLHSFAQSKEDNSVASLAQTRAKAEMGDQDSQVRLGKIYEIGEGAPQDYVQAYKWYNIAAATGQRNAAPLRNLLAGKMTPEQIAEGQKASIEFLEAKRSSLVEPNSNQLKSLLSELRKIDSEGKNDSPARRQQLQTLVKSTPTLDVPEIIRDAQVSTARLLNKQVWIVTIIFPQ